MRYEIRRPFIVPQEGLLQILRTVFIASFPPLSYSLVMTVSYLLILFVLSYILIEAAPAMLSCAADRGGKKKKSGR